MIDFQGYKLNTYKEQHLVVPDREYMLDLIRSFNLTPDQNIFFEEILQEFNPSVEYINSIQLDRYRFNFYGFQKPDFNLGDFMPWIKAGYNSVEINRFNAGDILKNPELKTYVKYSERDLTSDYYNEIQKHFDLEIIGGLLKFNYVSDCSIIPDLEKDARGTILEVLELVKDYYHRGLWLNGVSTYSLRRAETGIVVFDPDIFYCIDQNPDIPNTDQLTEETFMRMYIDLKGRPKDLTYILNKNSITKEALEFMYWNYIFNEVLTHELQKLRDTYDN